MSQIEKLNQKIREMVTEGYTPDEAICDLALTAGLENFNPFRATEAEDGRILRSKDERNAGIF